MNRLAQLAVLLCILIGIRVGIGCGNPCTPVADPYVAIERGLRGECVDYVPGAPQKPPEEPDSVTPPPACPAAVAASDGACVACAKTSCCQAMGGCSGDTRCTCLLGCRGGGQMLSSCTAANTCGATDPAYDAAHACLAMHCPEQCPEQR